jgi:hypothetical protein
MISARFCFIPHFWGAGGGEDSPPVSFLLYILNQFASSVLENNLARMSKFPKYL